MYKWRLYGVYIGSDMDDDARVFIEGNTITGVQVGLLRDSGNLDPEEVLGNNTFDEGSRVVGLRLPAALGR